jgi:tRNA G18 (ribose-2'-O)-methylase SpoU
LYSVDLKGPVVLVMGGEGGGCAPHPEPLRREGPIPILGKVESLNASSAAAVCIFEVIRQRHGAKAG